MTQTSIQQLSRNAGRLIIEIQSSPAEVLLTTKLFLPSCVVYYKFGFLCCVN